MQQEATSVPSSSALPYLAFDVIRNMRQKGNKKGAKKQSSTCLVCVKLQVSYLCRRAQKNTQKLEKFFISSSSYSSILAAHDDSPLHPPTGVALLADVGVSWNLKWCLCIRISLVLVGSTPQNMARKEAKGWRKINIYPIYSFFFFAFLLLYSLFSSFSRRRKDVTESWAA